VLSFRPSKAAQYWAVVDKPDARKIDQQHKARAVRVWWLSIR